MEDTFDTDGVVERLRALGRTPVDPATQSAHLTAMAEAVATSPRSVFASRLKLAAAALAGFVVGTTGLASAGALGPLQPVAARVVEAATPLEVPQGKADRAAKAAEQAAAKAENGGVERKRDDCPAGAEDVRNRGQFLKWARENAASDEQLAAWKKLTCGMPVTSQGTPGGDDDAEGEAEETVEVPAPPGPNDNANDRATAGSENGKGNGKPDCVGTERDPADTGKPECTPGGGEAPEVELPEQKPDTSEPPAEPEQKPEDAGS